MVSLASSMSVLFSCLDWVSLLLNIIWRLEGKIKNKNLRSNNIVLKFRKHLAGMNTRGVP